MSDISFRCPACSGVLVVDEAGIGWEVDCPMCGEPLTIPEKGDPSLVEPPVVEPPRRHPSSSASAKASAPEASAPKVVTPPPDTVPKAQGPAYDRKPLRPDLPEAKRPEGVEEAAWDRAKQYICGFAEEVFKRTLQEAESNQVAAVTFMSSLGAKLAKQDPKETVYRENNTTNRRLARALILCKINPAPEVLG